VLDLTGPFLHVPQVGEHAPQHRGGVTEQPAIERCRCDSEVEVDGGIIRCGVQFSQSLRVGELVEVRASQEADHVALPHTVEKLHSEVRFPDALDEDSDAVVEGTQLGPVLFTHGGLEGLPVLFPRGDKPLGYGESQFR
jgi:hypothetical protein